MPDITGNWDNPPPRSRFEKEVSRRIQEETRDIEERVKKDLLIEAAGLEDFDFERGPYRLSAEGNITTISSIPVGYVPSSDSFEEPLQVRYSVERSGERSYQERIHQIREALKFSRELDSRDIRYVEFPSKERARILLDSEIEDLESQKKKVEKMKELFESPHSP